MADPPDPFRFLDRLITAWSQGVRRAVWQIQEPHPNRRGREPSSEDVAFPTSSENRPDHVSVYPRPKTWHCVYCGWRCDETYNDYLCKQCERVRPFMGGSATLTPCHTCHHWNLLLAAYCEWCGAAMS